jgi:hypothetical protein
MQEIPMQWSELARNGAHTFYVLLKTFSLVYLEAEVLLGLGWDAIAAREVTQLDCTIS